MFDYSPIVGSVNRCHDHYGSPPKQNARLRAFGGAALLLKQVLGIDTELKAAIFVGVSKPTLHAALTVLKSQDLDLIADVLDGHASLMVAAAQVSNRARLIDAFNNASVSDRAAFGRVIGAGELFDAAVAPSL